MSVEVDGVLVNEVNVSSFVREAAQGSLVVREEESLRLGAGGAPSFRDLVLMPMEPLETVVWTSALWAACHEALAGMEEAGARRASTGDLLRQVRSRYLDIAERVSSRKGGAQ